MLGWILGLGAAGAAAWLYLTSHKKTVPLPGGQTATVTTQLEKGKIYALNVFVSRPSLKDGLSILAAISADYPMITSAGRVPEMVQTDIATTPYTIAQPIDQWIVYVLANDTVNLPLNIGPGKAIVQSGIELNMAPGGVISTTARPGFAAPTAAIHRPPPPPAPAPPVAPGALPAPHVSGHWRYEPSSPWRTNGGKY